MPYYVMLNFEDADPNAKAGLQNAIKGKHVATMGSVGGAAAGTVKIYQNRALSKSSFFKQKEVVYYSCQEILQRDKNKSLTKDELAKVRKDCQSAKTIGIIIHGTPSDTEHGFSTQGGQLCTWKELANLMLLMLPDGKEYNIALVMCYAARSQQADLDHNGHIPASQLQTSFAYKFFRAICTARNIRMSARTGAVSNDANINHTVETEEQVMYQVKKTEANLERTQNKAVMDQRKAALLAKGTYSTADFAREQKRFHDNPNLQPTNELETFVKQYMIYSADMAGFIQNQFDAKKLGSSSKYGKLIYTYDGALLEILARYDTSSHGANYSLYKGSLL